MPRGDDRRDPLIIFRAPTPLRDALYAHAAAEGRSVSDVAREAVEACLPQTPPNPSTGNTQPNPVIPTRKARSAKATTCQHRVKLDAYCRRCNS